MFENLDKNFLLCAANRALFGEYLGDEGIHTDSGATRFCVMFKEQGIVLKRDDGDLGKGYCKREVFLYQKAKQYNVDAAFLPIEYYGEGWFIQPYAKWSFSSGKIDVNGISKKHIVKYNIFKDRMEDVDINSYWLSFLYYYYGWDFFKSFFHFCKRYRVNDLHSGNVGFIGKRPIVFDYSGVPWKGRC